jgi:tRNA(Ile)-lysidine synthase
MAVMFEIPWLKDASRKVRLLVAVSGGADSVALLHLLAEAGCRNLIVCHLDHRLRGRASTGDARFVERLAARLGFKAEIGRVDVRKRMKECGESMETAARHARHEFFAECAKQHRCNKVLLAHHADDQAETVLWNLLRGSHGLKGMRDEQEIVVEGRKLQMIRPLLGLRHAALVAWLEERGLPWREDASNQQPVALRNRLRSEVFPLLAELTGRDAVMPFVRAAEDSRERDEMERGLLAAARLLDPQGRLHLPALRKLPQVLQRSAIRDYLLNAGISSIDRALLDRALEMLEPKGAPSVNLPGGSRLRRSGGRLWIATTTTAFSPCQLSSVMDDPASP